MYRKLSGRLSVTRSRVREQACEHLQIARGQCIELRLRYRCHRLWKRCQLRAHERRQECDLTAGSDPRVRRQDLLGERRAGAEHSADEHRTSRLRQPCSRGLTRLELGDQRIDECFMRTTIVRGDGSGTLSAVAIRRSVRRKRRVPGTAGVQHLAERESQVSPVGGRSRRVGDRRAQSRDQRIIRPHDFLQTCVSRQCDVAARLQREDFFVERAGVGLLAEVLSQVREIQQRGNVIGIECQRRLQLALGSVVLTQAVGINDAAVEVNFLGLCDAAIQRLLIGRERRIETAGLPLQPREVVPGVRQVGPACEHAQVGGFGLGETPGLLQRQPRCAARPADLLCTSTTCASGSGARRRAARGSPSASSCLRARRSRSARTPACADAGRGCSSR